MKTLKITLNSVHDFEKISALLHQLNLEKDLKITEIKHPVDPVTLLSQESLSEEWDSIEDTRWDNLL
mgnify:CR=1 FL=1